MLQPTVDEAASGNIVHAFGEPTVVTLVEDVTAMDANLRAQWARELQGRLNSMATGKALTPQDTAAFPNLGTWTVDRINLCDAMRSLKIKDDLFPALILAVGAGARHPRIRVPTGLVLPWFAQPMIEGRGTRKYKGRHWHPCFCWNFNTSDLPTRVWQHADRQEDITRLYDLIGLKTYTYNRDNENIAKSNFWSGSTSTPLAHNRDINNDDTNVYCFPEDALDYNLIKIHIAFGRTPRPPALGPIQNTVYNIDDSDAAKDAAAAAAQAAGYRLGGAAIARDTAVVTYNDVLPVVKRARLMPNLLCYISGSIAEAQTQVCTAAGKGTSSEPPQIPTPDPIPKANQTPTEPSDPQGL